MRHLKATVWGAVILGVGGLLGALLGPSPLVVPLAPFLTVVYVPFAMVAAALDAPIGLAELSVWGKTAFVAWCAVLGAGAGRLIGAWRTRRRRQ